MRAQTLRARWLIVFHDVTYITFLCGQESCYESLQGRVVAAHKQTSSCGLQCTKEAPGVPCCMAHGRVQDLHGNQALDGVNSQVRQSGQPLGDAWMEAPCQQVVI